ncbi:MAG: ATP-binding protein [Bryobacterales bacterium]|nr:ATP-binding protein [Bryobacterales bacterium]
MGIPVIGKDPKAFVPGAYVQFLRRAGAELSDAVKDAEAISGPLSERILRVEEKLEAHIELARDLTSGPREVVRSDYPPAALRQLVRNAVLHRNYEGTNASVRIYGFDDEIHGPGGPFGQVSRGNFGPPGVTDYRNPHLAEAMRNLGFVQKFGFGIPIARKALGENGNPLLEFVVEDTHVVAIVAEAATTVPVIAFFNKSGVGKTPLVCHLAWMYAHLDVPVVATDLDPQANLTAMLPDEEQLGELPGHRRQKANRVRWSAAAASRRRRHCASAP